MLAKFEDTTKVIQYLTDDDGNPLENIPCPVSCGNCCKFWVDVPELTDRFPRRSANLSCPYQRPRRGCKLKRSRRPKVCNLYLCEIGMALAGKKITKEQAQEAVNNEWYTVAFSKFGIEPDQEKVVDLGAVNEKMLLPRKPIGHDSTQS